MPIKNPPLFQQALDAVEPLLRGMNQNLSTLPKASQQSLQKFIQASLPPSFSKDFIPKKSTSLPVPGDHLQDGRVEKLALLRTQALACTRCPHLVKSRTQVVFGVGNPYAEVMFVGEAPGEEEDLRGEPFVGKAGELLTKIIHAMDYSREEIFIANILKCRPNMPPGVSGNRKPKPEEMSTCIPWLIQQIELIKPRVLVAWGSTAMEGLLGKTMLMREARGRWFEFQHIPLMVTYHPAYLLRNQSLGEKRKVWEDMLQVLEKLDRPISAKQYNFFLPK
ncbi:MAG: uracil-DNA glycosylase [Chthoniobacterales bacterium]